MTLDDEDINDIQETSEQEKGGLADIIDRIYGKVSPAAAAAPPSSNGNRNNNTTTNNSDDQQGEPRKSFAEILVELAEKNTELLFKDQYNTPYALVHISDHNELIRLQKSKKFERLLSKWFYTNNNGKIPNAEALSNAIRVIEAKAEFDGQTIPLSLRTAWHNGDIYYDLTNDKWQCIKISKEGYWNVIQNPKVMFTRFNQIPQVIPDSDYDKNIFDEFLDLMYIHESNQRLLVKAWTISLLIPEIPHPIESVYSAKGGLKSTFCRFVKRLVDPDSLELLTIPKEKPEFVQQLYHNYLAIYDNVKHLPYWFSDEMCKAVTGVGNSKRGLYTDDEAVIYKYKLCIMLNGINNNLTEPDALDRTILTDFKRIKPEERKQEAEIEFRFDYMKPKLLGYIFDTLAKTLQIAPTVQLSDLPRMADFAVWGEAIARAMGCKELEFINAYYDNIGRQNIEATENHPLSQAIMKYFESNPQQEELAGSPKEVLEVLETTAVHSGIDTNQSSWPKSANWLSKRLNQIGSNLLEGLKIDVSVTRTIKDPTTGKVNMSSVKLRKIAPIPPIPPTDQDHEGTLDQTIGDIGDIGGISGAIKDGDDDDDQHNDKKKSSSSHISSDKQKVFWKVWNELAAMDSGIVEHNDLQDRLISTRKFYAGDAHQVIADMLKLGEIVEVDFHKYSKRKEGGEAGD
jgi:hypothetical protein